MTYRPTRKRTRTLDSAIYELKEKDDSSLEHMHEPLDSLASLGSVSTSHSMSLSPDKCSISAAPMLVGSTSRKKRAATRRAASMGLRECSQMSAAVRDEMTHSLSEINHLIGLCSIDCDSPATATYSTATVLDVFRVPTHCGILVDRVYDTWFDFLYTKQLTALTTVSTGGRQKSFRSRIGPHLIRQLVCDRMHDPCIVPHFLDELAFLSSAICPEESDSLPPVASRMHSSTSSLSSSAMSTPTPLFTHSADIDIDNDLAIFSTPLRRKTLTQLMRALALFQWWQSHLSANDFGPTFAQFFRDLWPSIESSSAHCSAIGPLQEDETQDSDTCVTVPLPKITVGDDFFSALMANMSSASLDTGSGESRQLTRFLVDATTPSKKGDATAQQSPAGVGTLSDATPAAAALMMSPTRSPMSPPSIAETRKRSISYTGDVVSVSKKRKQRSLFGVGAPSPIPITKVRSGLGRKLPLSPLGAHSEKSSDSEEGSVGTFKETSSPPLTSSTGSRGSCSKYRRKTSMIPLSEAMSPAKGGHMIRPSVAGLLSTLFEYILLREGDPLKATIPTQSVVDRLTSSALSVQTLGVVWELSKSPETASDCMTEAEFVTSLCLVSLIQEGYSPEESYRRYKGRLQGGGSSVPIPKNLPTVFVDCGFIHFLKERQYAAEEEDDFENASDDATDDAMHTLAEGRSATKVVHDSEDEFEIVVMASDSDDDSEFGSQESYVDSSDFSEGGGIGTAEMGPEMEVPPLSAENKASAMAFFKKLDRRRRGVVAGATVKKFFMKSGLPEICLAVIWDLCDTDESGSLSSSQFCVGMHLIDCVRLKKMSLADLGKARRLPQHLMDQIGSRKRGRKNAAAENSSDDSSDVDLFRRETSAPPPEEYMASAIGGSGGKRVLAPDSGMHVSLRGSKTPAIRSTHVIGAFPELRKKSSDLLFASKSRPMVSLSPKKKGPSWMRGVGTPQPLAGPPLLSKQMKHSKGSISCHSAFSPPSADSRESTPRRKVDFVMPPVTKRSLVTRGVGGGSKGPIGSRPSTRPHIAKKRKSMFESCRSQGLLPMRSRDGRLLRDSGRHKAFGGTPNYEVLSGGHSMPDSFFDDDSFDPLAFTQSLKTRSTRGFGARVKLDSDYSSPVRSGGYTPHFDSYFESVTDPITGSILESSDSYIDSPIGGLSLAVTKRSATAGRPLRGVRKSRKTHSVDSTPSRKHMPATFFGDLVARIESDIRTPPVRREAVGRFQQHMSLSQAAALRIGDALDFKDKCGKFRRAEVCDFEDNELEIRFVDSLRSPMFDSSGRLLTMRLEPKKPYFEWCDFTSELYRLALAESITKRPVSRKSMAGLCKEGAQMDFYDSLHTERWLLATVVDADCGQCCVTYNSDGVLRWNWLHLDDSSLCAPKGTRTSKRPMAAMMRPLLSIDVKKADDNYSDDDFSPVAPLRATVGRRTSGRKKKHTPLSARSYDRDFSESRFAGHSPATPRRVVFASQPATDQPPRYRLDFQRRKSLSVTKPGCSHVPAATRTPVAASRRFKAKPSDRKAVSSELRKKRHVHKR